jgi:hypothetical protein
MLGRGVGMHVLVVMVVRGRGRGGREGLTMREMLPWALPPPPQMP